MRYLLTLLLSVSLAAGATTFTEFYVQTTGSNLNAGSTTGDNAVYTATNGNWDGTSIYIPTDGSNPSGTVSVGDWASVYLDAATVAVYVARVTTVTNAVNGGIILDTSAKGGTAPASGGTGRTIKVGGAWKGPNAAESFPFGFVTATMTNLNSGVAQGFVPRVNIKGGTTYNITAAMIHANNGPVRFQGYTSSVGDSGKATIDGGTSGISYILLTVSAANTDIADLIFANNGASGSAVGISSTGVENCFIRDVVHDVRGSGFNLAVVSMAMECEAYLCNKNGATAHGFAVTTIGGTLLRCVSHDNAGANTDGFNLGAGTVMERCIADSNGRNGATFTGVTQMFFNGCDFYNNTGSGIDLSGASATVAIIQNSNFIKNGAFGINSSGSPIRNGQIVNCGFGTGTQTNTSGSIAAVGGMNETGTVNYASNVTPWVDPANGDFRINLSTAEGAGRGAFTETQASYTGTIAYPDIGAAQHLESAGGGQSSHVFGQ